jgi:hypothetical protein
MYGPHLTLSLRTIHHFPLDLARRREVAYLAFQLLDVILHVLDRPLQSPEPPCERQQRDGDRQRGPEQRAAVHHARHHRQGLWT